MQCTNFVLNKHKIKTSWSVTSQKALTDVWGEGEEPKLNETGMPVGVQ